MVYVTLWFYVNLCIVEATHLFLESDNNVRVTGRVCVGVGFKVHYFCLGNFLI